MGASRPFWPTIVLAAGFSAVSSCAQEGSGAPAGALAFDDGAPGADTTFARLHSRLSEPGGFFDTDNLISNEASYLHVLGPLRDRDVRGGAYIGVGPGQNFSYIAAIRPTVAFIVDIRRDNALQHLLFKALFELAETRVEYLSLLHGAPAPRAPGEWLGRAVEEIVAYVEGSQPVPSAADRARARIDSAVVTFGIPLSEADRATIRRIHDTFIRVGPAATWLAEKTTFWCVTFNGGIWSSPSWVIWRGITRCERLERRSGHEVRRCRPCTHRTWSSTCSGDARSAASPRTS